MRILLVCSGNTCRSPLAAVMLTDMVTTAGWSDIAVSSAGTGAWDGAPASEGSYLVALERGLDLSGHRARLLTAQHVRDADLVLTMSESHARRVADLGGGGKVHTLPAYAGQPGGRREVADPAGGSVAEYRATAEILEDLLTRAMDRLRTGRDR